jgi:hypothetical protein
VKPPSFANLITIEGWVFYNFREENEVCPCCGCGHLTEYGHWNMRENLWYCEKCYEREVEE